MVVLQLLILLVALHTADGALSSVEVNCELEEWENFCGLLDLAHEMNKEALNLMPKKLPETNSAIDNLKQLDVQKKSDMLQPLLEVLQKEVDALTELKEKCKYENCVESSTTWCDDMMNWVSQGICALSGAVIDIADKSQTINEAEETFTTACSEWMHRNRTFFDITKNLGMKLLSIRDVKAQN